VFAQRRPGFHRLLDWEDERFALVTALLDRQARRLLAVPSARLRQASAAHSRDTKACCHTLAGASELQIATFCCRQALAASSASFADSLYGLRRVPVDARDGDRGASGASATEAAGAGADAAPARALSRQQQRWTLLLLVRWPPAGVRAPRGVAAGLLLPAVAALSCVQARGPGSRGFDTRQALSHAWSWVSVKHRKVAVQVHRRSSGHQACSARYV
jgi:hypothetical protein